MVTHITTRVYRGHTIRYAVTKDNKVVYNFQDPDKSCLHSGTRTSIIMVIREAKRYIDECLREGISSACS